MASSTEDQTNDEGMYRQAHDKLVVRLKQSGTTAVGTLDNSTTNFVKIVLLGQTVHECPGKVLDFILEESALGSWTRYTLYEYINDESEEIRIVFWRKFINSRMHAVEVRRGKEQDGIGESEQCVSHFANPPPTPTPPCPRLTLHHHSSSSNSKFQTPQASTPPTPSMSSQ